MADFVCIKKQGLLASCSMIKIKRIKFLIIASLLLLLSHTALSSAYEVVAVKSADIKPYNDALRGFKTTCECSVRELDISEIGRSGILREINGTGPDAVLAIGLDAFRHLRSISNIPLVYTMVPYVDTDTLSENISGVSMEISVQTYINAIMDIFPSAHRIGLIYSRKTESLAMETIRISGSKGIKIIAKLASTPAEVPSIIDGMKDRIDVFWMLPDTTVVTPETVNYMLLFSFQNKIPIFTFSKKYVEMGAVASLGINPFDLGSQAGEIMNRLLYEKDVKSPVRATARKTVLSINKKVAVKLGIMIRDEILRKADVID